MKRKKELLVVLLIIISLPLHAKQYGSDQTPSRQTEVFLPTNASSNALKGFSSFERGIILGSQASAVDFDALFPIQGSLVLNGGKVKLKKDIAIQTPFKMGPGVFEGENGQTLTFPISTTSVGLPAQGYEKILSVADEIPVRKRTVNAGGAVVSLDWSYDDTYLAVMVNDVTTHQLQVYFFEDNVLTLTAMRTLSVGDGNAVRWHPSSYLMAIGKTTNNRLETISFDPLDGMTTVSGVTTSGPVTALSWNAAGDRLAIGMDGVQQAVAVYTVSGGLLGSSTTFNFSTTRSVQLNALAFDPSGQYLAAGLDLHASNNEFFVLHYNGSSLAADASVDIGQTVNSVDWHPEEFSVVIGLAGGSERMRLYTFNNITHSLIERTAAYVDESLIVYAGQWDPSGTFFASGIANDVSGHELKIYYYLLGEYQFNLVSGYEAESNVTALRWSHVGDYIAQGDADGLLGVFNFIEEPLIFNNVQLAFNSDVDIRSMIHFQGSCVFNGGGNIINLLPSGSLLVEEGATLSLENASIKGVGSNNIRCSDDASRLILRDIDWLQDDDTNFTAGSLVFAGKVLMSGPYVFAYQSSRTSTISSRSTVKLDLGLTFSYDPIAVASKELIECINNTSFLELDGATLHTTVTGMQLTKGHLNIKSDSYIASEIQVVDNDTIINEGITFGNSVGDDLKVEIFAGASLQLIQGTLHNKNVSSTGWNFRSNSSELIISSNARLNLFESININAGYLVLQTRSSVGLAANKQILGAVRPLGTYVILPI